MLKIVDLIASSDAWKLGIVPGITGKCLEVLTCRASLGAPPLAGAQAGPLLAPGRLAAALGAVCRRSGGIAELAGDLGACNQP